MLNKFSRIGKELRFSKILNLDLDGKRKLLRKIPLR